MTKLDPQVSDAAFCVLLNCRSDCFYWARGSERCSPRQTSRVGMSQSKSGTSLNLWIPRGTSLNLQNPKVTVDSSAVKGPPSTQRETHMFKICLGKMSGGITSTCSLKNIMEKVVCLSSVRWLFMPHFSAVSGVLQGPARTSRAESAAETKRETRISITTKRKTRRYVTTKRETRRSKKSLGKYLVEYIWWISTWSKKNSLSPPQSAESAKDLQAQAEKKAQRKLDADKDSLDSFWAGLEVRKPCGHPNPWKLTHFVQLQRHLQSCAVVKSDA